ncbi:MAG: hypothetical protein OEV78_13100 [Spirochaetia bacterium]|nr:hypothetical protein [Spirochaetia bacterium]
MNIKKIFGLDKIALLLSIVVRSVFVRNNYKAKLMALMEGLEIQCIDKMLRNGNVDDYKLLGKSYVIGVQNKINEAINNVFTKE